MSIYWLLIILTFIWAATPLLQATLGPILIYQKNRELDGSHYAPRSWEALPAVTTEFFTSVYAMFAKSGFRQAGLLEKAAGPSSTWSYVMLLVNRETCVTAVVGQIFLKTPKGVKETCVVLFETELRAGGRVVTTNSKSPGVFTRNPAIKGHRLPQLTHYFDLYRAHCRILDLQAQGLTRSIAEPGEEVRAFIDNTTNALQYQAQRGMFQPTAMAGIYRPTAKGALLMTWKMVKPIVNVRLWRQNRHALRILKEIQMEGLAL